jgi:hypothetical protein
LLFTVNVQQLKLEQPGEARRADVHSAGGASHFHGAVGTATVAGGSSSWMNGGGGSILVIAEV